ncbi:unnamed protein product [Paramecium sonneborni]|uniref:Casein kinase I n=1 Tax=Paramecium sonneborni TaxID=65129 RepID=A0A8S1RLC6_9CILI|nr:unnamed protein product [Paramecium sonneborni]
MYLQAPQYLVLENLRCSSEHLIYKAENILDSDKCAIKIEKTAGLGQIRNEIEMLRKLKGIIGIPALKQFGVTSDNKSFLIIPLYHSSLRDLIAQQQPQLSLSQILRIGLRITEILEKVHLRNILHLDIKPENIMISKPLDGQKILQDDIIQIIDFGLSQEYSVNSNSLKNMFIGSLNFASRQSHKGEQLGYKDDLESLIYVLIYLRTLKLPWSFKPSWGCKKIDIKVIGKIKSSRFNNLAQTSNFPPQFQEIMSSINSLKHNIMPDYQYIKNLFIILIKQSEISVYQMTLRFKSLNYFDTSIQVNNSKENFQEESEENSDEMVNFETNHCLISKEIAKYKTNQIKSISDLQF